ncbi:MAG: GNAT family N-acetyltransferase [Rhodobacteraceae bacterium]|nr:GNAT family N-acetyltransferase [Paracoccaceae bacterium]
MTGAGRIRIGIAPGHRVEVARLYWQAFGTKLGPIMGPEAQAVDYLARVMREDQVLTATSPKGDLLGMAGFRTSTGAFPLGRWAEMRAVYGIPGALWRAGVMRLLQQDLNPSRFLVDGIAVADTMRGRGIGTALLDALCAEASGRGYVEVGLDVADVNPRARALYERRGFVARDTVRMGLVGPIFGMASVTRMVRRLV